jgi:hypothetical protein
MNRGYENIELAIQKLSITHKSVKSHYLLPKYITSGAIRLRRVPEFARGASTMKTGDSM